VMTRLDTPRDGGLVAAVFDLGGVVVRIDPARTYAAWARATGLSAEQVAERYRFDETYERYECGQVTSGDYHHHVAGLLGRGLSFDDFRRGWTALLAGLIDGIDRLIEQMAGTLRLLVLSNTNALHQEAWRRLYAPVLGHFERVFCSHEIGVRKPHPGCYRPVLDYLCVEPGRVAFIDDHPPNVAAAESLGMCGIFAHGPDEIVQALQRRGIDVSR
jgi:HAD superfamily hydrolase (TIGR01509 family)